MTGDPMQRPEVEHAREVAAAALAREADELHPVAAQRLDAYARDDAEAVPVERVAERDRTAELYALARETRDDPEAFRAGLDRLAEQELDDVLDLLHERGLWSYSELLVLAGRLTAAAGLLAEREAAKRLGAF